MNPHSLHARLAGLAVLLTICLNWTAAQAGAQAQTNNVTPTAWWWQTNVTLATVNARVAAGYRIVDIEVEDDNPLRFSAAFVHNSGSYAKGWWWYYGQTAAQVNSRLSQHNARLIDVEPYHTPNGLRFAIVLISNTGQDFASTHGWQYGWTFSQVANRVANPAGRRIIDIQPYFDGGSQRYAFIYLNNSGNHASGWWVYLNTSPAFIASALNSNNARLIDLESHEGTDNFSCVMVPNDGNEWFWFYGLVSSQIDFLANQYAQGRIIDIQRYTTGPGALRYLMVVRRNDNDLALATTTGMRSYLPFGASSGFVMREFNGASSTLAGVYENRVFEPASLMKTVHHFTAFREIALGNDALTNVMIENQGLNGSCPTGTNPVIRTLSSVLRSMMENSSNTATEAIRARYGTAFIEAVAALFGATNVELNHTLGCLCGNPRNEVTLVDLADLHDAVTGGVMGNFRDEFYEHMSNGTNFGMGSFSTTTVLNQELAASSLNAADQQAFRDGMLFAHKGGSYTCIGGGTEEHRSRGAYVRLPHRSGCDTVMQEYFIGAWVNDATTATQATEAVGSGLTTLFRERVRAAIDTWEAAVCNPFVTYCTATPNSTGQRATISAVGSPVASDNNLTIRAASLPPNVFGHLLVSQTQGFVQPPGSSGNLCLGGSIGRYSGNILNSGPGGTYSMAIDLTAIPHPSTPPYSVGAGDRLNFQWWYRDMIPGAGVTSNFTFGLEATFQ